MVKLTHTPPTHPAPPPTHTHTLFDSQFIDGHGSTLCPHKQTTLAAAVAHRGGQPTPLQNQSAVRRLC
jgi:hypothetical protein